MSITKLSKYFQNLNIANSNEIINHQGWKISLVQDCNEIKFKLTDRFNQEIITPRFLIEDVEVELLENLKSITSVNEQQAILLSYLSTRLIETNKYSIHIEDTVEGKAIRFGAYGLVGGAPVHRNDAYVFSGLQVLAGGFLIATGVGAVVGAGLVSSGVSGGLYVYNQEDDYIERTEHLKKCAYGGVGGLISGGVGSFVGPGAALVDKVVVQGFGAALGAGTSSTAESIIEKNEFPSAENLKRNVLGAAAGGGIGVLGGELTSKIIGEVSDDFLSNVFKGTAESVASAASSTISSNAAVQAVAEAQEGEDLSEASLKDGLVESLVISFFLGAYTSSIKQLSINQLKDQLQNEQNNLEAVQAEDVNEHFTVEELQHQIDELGSEMQQEKAQLDQANQEVQNAESHLQAIQSDASTTQAQLEQAQRNLNQAVQHEQQVLNDFKKTANDYLKEGFKAKIDGHYSAKTAEEIAQMMMEGKEIEWKKGQNRIVGKRVKATYESNAAELKKAAQDIQNQVQTKLDQVEVDLRRVNQELEQNQNNQNDLQHKVDSDQAKLMKLQSRLQKERNFLSKLNKKLQVKVQKEIQNLQDALDGVQNQPISPFDPSMSSAGFQPLAWGQDEDGLEPLDEAQDPRHQGPSDVASQESRFTDAPWQELKNHVVLVHAINQDTSYIHGSSRDDLNMFLSENQMGAINNCSAFEGNEHINLRSILSVLGVVTQDGTIGSQLDYDRNEFKEKLQDRPTLHFSWNQLVEPNLYGNWEDSKIAILEPLKALEESDPLFGISPYDSLSMQPHKLSKDSIILVPQSVYDQNVPYLNEYEGKVLPYPDDQALRNAVTECLNQNYPDIWHTCDETGNLIANQVRRSEGGYRPMTCLKTDEGKIVKLIRSSGREESQRLANAMQNPGDIKRFIDLHSKAETYVLESDRVPYFVDLKKVYHNNAIVKNNAHFAGNLVEDNLDNWGILECIKKVDSLKKYDPKTGTHKFANSLLKHAIFADLLSVFYKNYPESEKKFSSCELRLMINYDMPYLINIIENIAKWKDSDETKPFALELYQIYMQKLQRCLVDNLKTIETTPAIINEASNFNKLNETPLCLLVAEEEWAKVQIPENIDFDLSKEHIQNNSFDSYCNKMKSSLPHDIQILGSIYSYLKSQDKNEFANESEKKEQYKRNIIKSYIYWYFYENTYANEHEEKFSSILNGSYAYFAEPTSKHGVMIQDNTQTVGNCLFDNVAAQLLNVVDHENIRLQSAKLRSELAQYMRDHSDEYSVFPDYTEEENILPQGDGINQMIYTNFNEYTNCIATDTVWATELELRILAEMLQSPIVVFRDNAEPLVYNRESERNPIFIYHVNYNHFTSCVAQKGLTDEDIFKAAKARNR